MRSHKHFLLTIISFCILIGAQAAHAQQLPPAEPPQQLRTPQGEPQVLEVTANEVLVPTLVEKSHGSIIYGLKAEDFIVEDDGVPQKIRLQEEMDAAPVALVVAVEQGAMSVLEFNKFSRLGPLLDLFLTDDRAQAALVGFDSEPRLLVDFTHSEEQLNEHLKRLQPGDGGAAILDTASYAVDLLESQPKDYRRVLLLISEERDHGSKHIKPEQLIRRIGNSDVLVLSVTFSPARAELLHDIKDNGDNRTMNIFSALLMAVQAVKKNVAKEIAVMSGGEYTNFTGDKGFEKRVADAAKRSRNRYLITFSPSNPKPGLHTLRVRLSQNYGAKVVARENYWMDEKSRTGN
jgi:VWFA-related protein